MNDDSPLVSVVIPVYNGSNYLNQAIDCALAQTYRNVEVLVVNDGSTDNGKTESIAKSYGNSIRYFAKRNGGVSTALNLGIQEMTGDYFAWLSHDDLYRPQNLEIQIGEIKKTPGVKVSFCDTLMFKDDPPPFFKKTIAAEEVENELVKGAQVFFKYWVYACSMVIHRSCFEETGFIDEGLRNSQDIELAMRLLDNYDTLHIKVPLGLRRNHSESGYNTYTTAVLKEASEVIDSAVNSKGLEYFCPGISDKVSIGKLFNQLGNHVIYNKELASNYFLKSKQHWPSLLNPSLLKLLVGNNMTRHYLRYSAALAHRFRRYVLLKPY